jgi:hypothetical protein
MKTKFLFILFAIFLIVVPASAYTLELYPVYDGYMVRAVADSTLISISNGVGTASAFTGASGVIGIYTGGATITNNFSEERKSGFTFDLSSLPLDAQITGVYLRVVPSAKTVTLGIPDVYVVAFNPDNKLAYATSDYNKFNYTPLSSSVASASIVTGYEKIIPLNSEGINLINNSRMNRYVSLGLVTSWDVNQVADYSLWAISRSAIYTVYYSEQTDTINDPKLIVTYTIPSTSINVGSSAGVQQEKFYETINLWILILLALVFLISAVIIKMPFLAFIGSVFCLFGLVASINTSFTSGLVSVIMLVATFVTGYSLSK